MTAASIDALAIGIPAHDEEERIEACLRSILEAARGLDVTVSIAVAADGCCDRTAAIAASVLDGIRSPRVSGTVIETRVRSAGAARAIAVDAAVAGLRGPLDRIWIATTDADTVVDPTWLRAHLAWAATGVDGIAGLVTVDWPAGVGTLPARYHASITPLGVTAGHRHVHGANLGLRAVRWSAVGGCGPSPVGEDHELWARLRRAGATVIGVDDLGVRTSGRLVGRAPRGFARYLADLVDDDQTTPGLDIAG